MQGKGRTEQKCAKKTEQAGEQAMRLTVCWQLLKFDGHLGIVPLLSQTSELCSPFLDDTYIDTGLKNNKMVCPAVLLQSQLSV